MDVDMKAITKTIKSMDMELLSGPMAESTSESGAKENSMVKEFTSRKVKRDKASGRWEKELSGSRQPRPTNELLIISADHMK
jgi:hypothetical protein